MSLSVKDLFERVGRLFVFNKETYPNFPEDPAQQRLFAIRHIQDHVIKSAGAIAGITEPADHAGGPTGGISQQGEQDLQLAAMKQLVNAVKLAEVVGVPPEGFVEYMNWKYPK
tara:strand:+ start:3059 stop:3397 length:339 start_codon:yes stop_codon:yes gene_type:complete